MYDKIKVDTYRNEINEIDLSQEVVNQFFSWTQENSQGASVVKLSPVGN